MPNYPYILGNTFVAVVIDSVPYSIDSSDARFKVVVDAIKRGDWLALPKLVNTAKAIEVFSFGSITVFDGEVHYKGVPISNAVVTRILSFIKEGYPYQPLVRFLDKLMLNPSKRSVDQLYAWLERYRLPITDEGDVICCKAVREDNKDIHSGTIDNSVGQVVKVERNRVSDDPAHSCHFGLHVGSESFVRSYGHKAVLVQINPRDVVSIPHDSSCQKMRVCEYVVLKELGPSSEIKDFGSDYAPETEQARDLYIEGVPLVEPREVRGDTPNLVDQFAKRKPAKRDRFGRFGSGKKPKQRRNRLGHFIPSKKAKRKR